MKKVNKILISSLCTALTVGLTVMPNVYSQEDNSNFTQRYQAEDFDSYTGNIYIRSNGDKLPVNSPVVGDSIVLNDADGGKYLDFSNPVTKFASNDMYGSEYQLTAKNDKNEPVESIVNDTVTWKIDVPQSGFYTFKFKYNNSATRVKGYRNDRDERNCRIMINTPVSEGNTEEFYTDSTNWAGWMIFNISGYNNQYDASTNTSLYPQTDNNYTNVIGNTEWNSNYMNIYLDEGENTVTLGIQAPPGQGVYDGPNLDYFDVTYVGDEYVSKDEIPYVNEDFKFEHPGIYFTMDDLETIKTNKDNLDTVYGKGYQEMKDSTFAKANYEPKFFEDIDVGAYNNPNKGFNELTKDGCAAYYNALMWYLDGDIANAKKAIEILNGWASTLKTIGDGNDVKLRIALSAPDYLNAAEILKHIYNNDSNITSEDKWQNEDIEKFDLFINKLLDETEGYYPQANGNWDALIGGFNMAAAVYLEDVNLFNNALTQLYLGNLQGGNTASMGSLPNYIYASGESQETSRDTIHSRMGLSGLAYQAEVAWNQGINLFSAYNDRLLNGAKYNATYLVGNDVESETFISDKSRGISDISSMVFEIVSNHYLNQVDGNQDVSVISEAANQRLRTGGTKNGAGTSAMYYGAMIFTEERMAINLDVQADKTVFTKIGDTITLKTSVDTNSKIKSLRSVVSPELKPYVSLEENNDGTIKVTLIKEPANNISGKVTVSTVKNASVTKEVTLSYQVPTISLSQEQLKLVVGQTTVLKADTTPNDIKVNWSSANEEIVTVTSDGTVKAIKAGQTEVIVTIEGTDISAKCNVIVEESNNNQNVDSVDTGDDNRISGYMVFGVLSVILYFVLSKKKVLNK